MCFMCSIIDTLYVSSIYIISTYYTLLIIKVYWLFYDGQSNKDTSFILDWKIHLFVTIRVFVIKILLRDIE